MWNNSNLPSGMNPERLEKMCLRRIKTDIVRHARKQKAERHDKSSLYPAFQKVYGNEMVSYLFKITTDFQGDVSISSQMFASMQEFISANFQVIQPNAFNIAAAAQNIHQALIGAFTGVQNMEPILQGLLPNPQQVGTPTRRNSQTVISTADYTDVVNFILNSHVTDISLSISVNEIITTAIANNCKNLRKLSVRRSSAELNTDFLKSLGNLVSLNLQDCSFPVVTTMKIIADHLEHLTVLSLGNSSMSNDGLFILCGHEHFCAASISSCAFIKHCSVNTKVKLRCLSFKISGGISREAFACVLTHIPTLQSLDIFHSVSEPTRNGRVVLSKVIADINDSRKAANVPIFQFQIDRLDFIKDSRVLTACLEACPKLKSLSLDFVDESIPGKILAENELSCLEVLHIKCLSVYQISGEDYDRFWSEKGSQIKELEIGPSSRTSPVEVDVYAIRKILAACRRITSLKLDGIEVPSLPTKYIWEEHPLLGDIRNLTVTAHGEIRSVAMFLYKIISSLRNESQMMHLSASNGLSVRKGIQDILNVLKEFICDRGSTKFGRKVEFSLCFMKERKILL